MTPIFVGMAFFVSKFCSLGHFTCRFLFNRYRLIVFRCLYDKFFISFFLNIGKTLIFRLHSTMKHYTELKISNLKYNHRDDFWALSVKCW